MSSYRIVRWNKDVNGRFKYVLEVFSALGHLPSQVATAHKFRHSIRLVMMVTMQHGFKSTC